MTLAKPRSGEQRKADTLAKLQAPGADVWVTSASVSEGGSAQPYVVPLSPNTERQARAGPDP